MPFKKGETPKGAKVFVKGQSGNPKGRGKKLISSTNDELKKEGYQPATARQIVESYELLLNLDEAKIKEVITDPERPMLIRIVGKAILEKNGFEAIEKILDRAHGKAKQQSDISLKGNIEVDYSKLSVEELNALLALQRKALPG
jgi:hypothetical protein